MLLPSDVMITCRPHDQVQKVRWGEVRTVLQMRCTSYLQAIQNYWRFNLVLQQDHIFCDLDVFCNWSFIDPVRRVISRNGNLTPLGIKHSRKIHSIQVNRFARKFFAPIRRVPLSVYWQTSIAVILIQNFRCLIFNGCNILEIACSDR